MVALDADVQKKLQEFSDKYFSGSDSEEKKEEEKQEVAKEERNGKEENQLRRFHTSGTPFHAGKAAQAVVDTSGCH